MQVSEVNWSGVSAVVSLLTLIGTVGIGGVIWGRLTERVATITKRLDVHRAELDIHEKQLVSHGQDLVRIDEWKRGFAAGREG